MGRVYTKYVYYQCRVIEEICHQGLDKGQGSPDCKNCWAYNDWVDEGRPKLRD